MERNIIKNLEDYKEKLQNGYFADAIDFKANEIIELIDYTRSENEKSVSMHRMHIKLNTDGYLFELLQNVWSAAYMSGYKSGARSARNKRAAAK